MISTRNYSDAAFKAGSARSYSSTNLFVLNELQHSLLEKRGAAFGRAHGGCLLVFIFNKTGKLRRGISVREMKRKRI